MTPDRLVDKLFADAEIDNVFDANDVVHQSEAVFPLITRSDESKLELIEIVFDEDSLPNEIVDS